MKRNDAVWIIAQIPIILSLLIAFIFVYVYGGNKMEHAWWISISIALIGVAGSLLANFFLFKRDAYSISEVKKETKLLDGISDNSMKTKEALLEEILPYFKGEDTFLSKINRIVSDVDYRRRVEEGAAIILQEDVSSTVSLIMKMEKTILHQAGELKKEKDKNRHLERENHVLKESLRRYQNYTYDAMENEEER